MSERPPVCTSDEMTPAPGARVSWTLCLALLVTVAVAGCASNDAGEVDGWDWPDVGLDTRAPEMDAGDTSGVDTDRRNACGGRGSLQFDGGPAEPGAECGCGGLLVCQGRESVTCVGAVPPNACGGCEPLGRALGVPCGPCRQGTTVCDGSAALRCDGAGSLNECGGCVPLDGGLDVLCESAEGPGISACAGRDLIVCRRAGDNDCGGTDTLGGYPGAPCGTCNQGELVCDGRDELACIEAAAPRNACGGCAPFAVNPGDPCDVCGAVWSCDGEGAERLVCAGTRTNACGGCEALGAFPGDSCTRDSGSSGVWRCDDANSLLCGEPGPNACGGADSLALRPGRPCGACGDGIAVCVGSDDAICLGGSTENACGGCTVLSGVPGASCGPDQRWACDGIDAVACQTVRRRIVLGAEDVVGTWDDAILQAPADATAEATVVTVGYADIDAVDGFVLTSRVYEFGPQGVDLDAPVRIIINTDEWDRSFLIWSEDGVSFEMIPGSARVTSAAGFVTADVNRLGFAFAGYPASNSCAGALNLCGGCEPLTDVPGARCGTCGDGTMTCSADGNDLVCAEASERNACGGCATLVDAPGDACGVCGNGLIECVFGDTDRTHCVGDTENACGGCEVLDDEPGAPCGACGDGAWNCTVDGTLQCVGAASNACGGCAPLEGSPGDACEGCAGASLVCSDDGESLICNDPIANACGGCGVLEGAPGDPCGACGGELVCTAGLDALQCDGATTNACGGCATLAGALGDPCGPCSSDRLVCDPSGEALVCDGATTNACGGCASLAANVGDACGPCGADELVCGEGGDELVCDGATTNVCGGCAALSPDVGAACVGCEAEPCTTVCAGPDDTSCGANPEGYVLIPAGSYVMGSPPDETGRDEWVLGYQEEQREITLSRSFWMSEVETTQLAWFEMMGNNPSSHFEEGPHAPVTDVTWWDAVAYANARSADEGLPPCYVLDACTGTAGVDLTCEGVTYDSPTGTPYGCRGYRLPTEAEWEYAARAGSTTGTYAGDLTDVGCADATLAPIAWFCGNASNVPHIVAELEPNAWGLYDMLGNAVEWVGDGYVSAGPSGTDPFVVERSGGPDGHRCYRGGGYHNRAEVVRSAARGYIDADERFAPWGFRLVRTVY